MSINFHIEFKGTNKITLDIEYTVTSPEDFEHVILAIKELVMEFRHT